MFMSNTDSKEYNVIGLMSGTSLDGVDIAFCKFTFDNQKWQFSIAESETIPYPSEWVNALLKLEKTDALSFMQAHVEYGYYLGKLVDDFVKKHSLNPDFVSSHGHTIFHTLVDQHIVTNLDKFNLPKRITTQIGSGSAISAACELTTVCDFRTMDVALGGQGAPLVPIGDELLFADYDFCLNLGGFANVSYRHNNKRIAFDICPVNIVMNTLCNSIGKNFDNEGEIAKSGKVNKGLLNELNALSFYQLPANKPKSLGKEWVLEFMQPLLNKHNLTAADALSTFCEHIALQIAKTLNDKAKGNLLITGGGAYNLFLLERIKHYVHHEVSTTDKTTIEFKEALIFAFLGVLRMRGDVNCLSSVTGARHDNCGGAIYHYRK